MKLKCNDGIVRELTLPFTSLNKQNEAFCCQCGEQFGIHDTKILKEMFKKHNCKVKIYEMPKKIKSKLRKLANIAIEKQQLEIEIGNIFEEEYDISIDVFNAISSNKVRTEALAYIVNAEGDTEDSIEEIEKVFLYYVNK